MKYDYVIEVLQNELKGECPACKGKWYCCLVCESQIFQIESAIKLLKETRTRLEPIEQEKSLEELKKGLCCQTNWYDFTMVGNKMVCRVCLKRYVEVSELTNAVKEVLKEIWNTDKKGCTLELKIIELKIKYGIKESEDL